MIDAIRLPQHRRNLKERMRNDAAGYHWDFVRYDAYAPASATVLTIGNFDGAHLGHQLLLETARRIAAPDATRIVALTFEPHPVAVLAPERRPPLLTTLPDRAALLKHYGADDVVVLRATAELLALEPRAFLDRVVAPLRPIHLVEGEDFHFGKRRSGSVGAIVEWARAIGCAAEVCDELRSSCLPGRPQIHSTAIREALATGDCEAARVMLGRPHRLVGRVGYGERRGARIGFPTANLEAIPQMTPRHAVYAAVAELATREIRMAAVNIGSQPTFGQDECRVEAHLLDFDGDLRGQRVALHFIARVREQIKFASIDALRAQLDDDVRRVAAMDAVLDEVRAVPRLPLNDASDIAAINIWG